MKIVLWTKHAANEASKFKLNSIYCENIIRDPDEVIEEGREKRRYIRYKKNKMIMAICEEDSHTITIKTIDVTTR